MLEKLRETGGNSEEGSTRRAECLVRQSNEIQAMLPDEHGQRRVRNNRSEYCQADVDASRHHLVTLSPMRLLRWITLVRQPAFVRGPRIPRE